MPSIKINSEVLQQFFKTIGEIADEGNLTFNKDGCTALLLDPSQISLIKAEIPRGAFNKFQFEKDLKLGLNLEQVKNILKGIKDKSAVIEIEFLEGYSNFIIHSGEMQQTIKINYLDISDPDISNLPKIDFDAEIKVNSKSLLDGIRAIDKERLIFIAEERFLKDFKINNNEQTISINAEVKANHKARAIFPKEYLILFLRTIKKNDINLYLKNNAPLLMKTNACGVEFSYYLAPRIESGEDSPAESENESQIQSENPAEAEQSEDPPEQPLTELQISEAEQLVNEINAGRQKIPEMSEVPTEIKEISAITPAQTPNICPSKPSGKPKPTEKSKEPIIINLPREMHNWILKESEITKMTIEEIIGEAMHNYITIEEMGED